MAISRRDETIELLRGEEALGHPLVPGDAATRKRLLRLVAKGDVLRPCRGAYVRVGYWRALSDEQKALHVMRALTKIDEDVVFSHVSAALALGLEVPRRFARKLHAINGFASATRSQGWIVRHTCKETDSIMHGGVRITSVNRTLFDCLRTLDLPEGLAVADSALRVLALDPADLEAFFLECGHQRGARHALQTLALADPRSENGGESIARGVMLELCCAPPVLQKELVNPLTGSSYRADFYWEGHGRLPIVGELDGKDKYLNPIMTGGRDVGEVLIEERLRESRISAREVKVMRFRFSELGNRGLFSELLDVYGVPRNADPPARHPHPRLYDGITPKRYA